MADCPLCGSIARDRFLLHCFLSRVEYRRGLRVLETSPRMGAGYRELMRRFFDYTASDFDLWPTSATFASISRTSRFHQRRSTSS